jgi:hypothetical protein
MTAALNIYRAVQAWDKSDGKSISDAVMLYIALDHERANATI